MKFEIDYDNEEALFNMMEESLYTAVICDILDDLGCRNQIMDMSIRPFDSSYVIAGRAKTILAADVYTIPDKPYELEIEAVDSVCENEIVVVATNRSRSNAFWGELLSTTAKAHGSRGAIIYGGTRDVLKIHEMGFKVFTSAVNPLDSKGRSIVLDYKCPIDCGGVKVENGDIVFADYDGIVVIPKSIEKEVIEKALHKIAQERVSLGELRKGAKLKDVFKKYGVL